MWCHGVGSLGTKVRGSSSLVQSSNIPLVLGCCPGLSNQRLDSTLHQHSSWWCHPPDKEPATRDVGEGRPGSSPHFRHLVFLAWILYSTSVMQDSYKCLTRSIYSTSVMQDSYKCLIRSINGRRNHNFLTAILLLSCSWCEFCGSSPGCMREISPAIQ
jgi:hypothetical protein